MLVFVVVLLHLVAAAVPVVAYCWRGNQACRRGRAPLRPDLWLQGLMHSEARRGRLVWLRLLYWLFCASRYPAKGSVTATLMIGAAGYGHLRVVKWLAQARLGLNSGHNDLLWCALAAAKNGHLDVLQWSVQRDPPLLAPSGAYKRWIFGNAVFNGHFHVAQWLHAQGSLSPTELNENAQTEAEYGNLDALKWLCGLPGVDPTANDNSAVRRAAMNCHKDVVMWMCGLPGVDLGANDSSAAVNLVFATEAHAELLEMLRWLCDHPAIDPVKVALEANSHMPLCRAAHDVAVAATLRRRRWSALRSAWFEGAAAAARPYIN